MQKFCSIPGDKDVNVNGKVVRAAKDSISKPQLVYFDLHLHIFLLRPEHFVHIYDTKYVTKGVLGSHTMLFLTMYTKRGMKFLSIVDVCIIQDYPIRLEGKQTFSRGVAIYVYENLNWLSRILI